MLDIVKEVNFTEFALIMTDYVSEPICTITEVREIVVSKVTSKQRATLDIDVASIVNKPPEYTHPVESHGIPAKMLVVSPSQSAAKDNEITRLPRRRRRRTWRRGPRCRYGINPSDKQCQSYLISETLI